MSKENSTPPLGRIRMPAQPLVTGPCRAPEAINIFASVSRALAHGLRGDLAVVASDLTYLATQIPALDIARPQRRIAHMVELLGQLDPLRSGFNPRPLPLSEVMTCFPGARYPLRTRRASPPPALPDDLTVPGDYTWLRWMARAVATLISAEPGPWKARIPPPERAALPPLSTPRDQRPPHPRTLELRLSTTYSPRAAERTETAAPTEWSYTTAEQYAARMHGESHVVIGGLIDLTLLGHGWWCHFRGSKRRSEVIICCPLDAGTVSSATPL